MTMTTKMNRSDKKKIDDLISLYHETYKESQMSYNRTAITMSDIRKTKIRKDLEHDTHIFNELKTDEQKSYFVNKLNEKMLKRRNDKYADCDEFVNPVSDILYHSVDDYFKHGCFLRDVKDIEIKKRNKNAVKQIERLQDVDVANKTSELTKFLEKNEFAIFRELERLEGKDDVTDNCSVQLHVPAIVLAILYKTRFDTLPSYVESEVA